MKQEDFDRLKVKLGDEFEAYNNEYGVVIVEKKKDIWEGVEYAECVISAQDYHLKGKIYKIASIHDNREGIVLIDSFGVNRSHNTFDRIKHFKPSTESSYIDQLKKEAFERFGEIKEGDRFINIYGHKGSTPDFNLDKSFYRKSDDAFFVYGIAVYRAGKWATKLPKRIEVKWDCTSQSSHANEAEFTFVFSDVKHIDLVESGEFLASQLEKYLNREIE